MRPAQRRAWGQWAAPAGWLGLFAAGLLVGLFAGAYVLDRSAVPSAALPEPDSYVVQEGRLGRTFRMPAIADWGVLETVYSPTAGVVTEVAIPSGLFKVGEVLLRVNERPVILLEGEIPAFRELSLGTQGRDVDALQRYLARLGHAVDTQPDRYSETTAQAVRVWQRSLGLPESGVVALGDVIILPRAAFSAPLRWVDTIRAGSTLSVGMPLLDRLAPSPRLWIEFGSSPPAQLGQGLQGEAIFPAGQRRPVVLGAIETSGGRQAASLSAASSTLCAGPECLDLVTAAGQTLINVEFTLVPETSGSLVPVAALRSDGTGQAFVDLLDGGRRPVTVRVTVGGSAIVDGIGVGEEIIIP